MSEQAAATQIATIDLFNVQVAIFRTEEQRVATMQSLGVKTERNDLSSNASAHFNRDDKGQGWFGMVLPEGARPSLIAHECIHIADWIMEDIGAPTGVENTELRAYMVQHLMDQVLETKDPEASQ